MLSVLRKPVAEVSILQGAERVIYVSFDPDSKHRPGHVGSVVVIRFTLVILQKLQAIVFLFAFVLDIFPYSSKVVSPSKDTSRSLTLSARSTFSGCLVQAGSQ